MPELHADSFSRHAVPLEVWVFVALDERGEDVISEEICCGCDGKHQRRHGGRSVQLPDWVMNKIEANILLLLPVGHQNEVTFVGGISERRPTNTTHHPPTFQCEAMRVSAKPLQREWVGIGRWVWVTKKKKYPRVNNKLSLIHI